MQDIKTIAAALFTLAWEPMTEGDRYCWAGAGDEAFLAEDSAGNTYCRSIVEGELLIDIVDAEGELIFNGKLSTH